MKKYIIATLIMVLIILSCKQESAESYLKRAKNEIKVKEKLDLLSKAIEIDSNYFDAIYERACLEADDAMSLKEMIKEKMADIGEDVNLYNDCLKDFDHVFKLNPNHAPSYFKRGIVEHWMGDTVKSCLDLNKAASLGYDHANALKEFCK